MVDAGVRTLGRDAPMRTELRSVPLARTGQSPLCEILRERITGPLGMESTAFFADPGLLPTA